jgi:hypothetical protein
MTLNLTRRLVKGTPLTAAEHDGNLDKLEDAIENIELTPGPAGATGATGATGPAGPQGAPGADGDGTAYYGQISRQASGTVAVAATGTFYPINLAGTFDTANSYGLIAGTAEQLALKNDTGEPQLFTVIGTADVRSANSQVLGLRLAVNGVTIPATECRVTTGTTNYGKLLSQWIVELANGEEVSLHVANHSGTTNITVDRAKVVAFTAGRQGEQGDKGDQGDPGPGTDLAYDAATRKVESSTGTDAEIPLVSTSSAGLQPATGFGAITYASSVALDLAARDGQVATITLTGALELTTNNLANGRSTGLRLIPGASARDLTFPTDWVFVSAKPASLPANKVARLSIECHGTTNADVVAAIAIQP